MGARLKPQPFQSEKTVPIFSLDDLKDSIPLVKEEEKVIQVGLSWAIRSTPNWMEGLDSVQTQRKWLNDAEHRMGVVRGSEFCSRLSPLSARTWATVIDGLHNYAALVDGLMQPGPLGGVTWVADGLVGDDLNARLQECSEALEKVARKENNWHPGTNGRLLNLIDPSMYALIPNESRILKAPFVPIDGQVENLVHFLSEDEISVDIASEHQWLPADVDVDLDGKAHFTSYVNNLYPSEHGEMYGVLEEILSTTFVPLWEKLLTDMRRQGIRNKSEAVEDSDDDDEEQFCVKLKGRKIQVVVRMSTTYLTPEENPRHPGGRWHVDGMPNEKVVSVGLYYYSNQNITTSKLGLREKFRTRQLCNIETNEGRSIVFSNELNHNVLPFELENPELPGHRKVLSFFLVDPGSPIISTARVPCQQRSWYVSELKTVFCTILPGEMVDKIANFLDTPMNLEKAKQARDAMRRERDIIILRVRNKDGEEMDFIMNSSTRIEELKTAYSKMTGITEGKQRFIFAGKQLEDGRTTEDYGINNGDVLHLVTQLRGD